MAARGGTALELYRLRETKARVAAGRGELGGQFIWARERRRRPTATGDGKESLGFGGEKSIRIELKSGDFQSDSDDVSKREKTEPQTKPYPLDMWKYGSALQQRPELNPYSGRGATSHNWHAPKPHRKTGFRGFERGREVYVQFHHKPTIP
uniref:Retrotransposon protein, putative, Ty3-gypsy subclass n=1 Tax=Oryza sativa subsp. japonica TaxID=39947 RepID=Q2R4D8_ORYSJ|nr:retrotransposon protein, putative, Ty3-gypsy subclass [Oryza sativa Japonica Group]